MVNEMIIRNKRSGILDLREFDNKKLIFFKYISLLFIIAFYTSFIEIPLESFFDNIGFVIGHFMFKSGSFQFIVCSFSG